jgi:hypothetical protein
VGPFGEQFCGLLVLAVCCFGCLLLRATFLVLSHFGTSFLGLLAAVTTVFFFRGIVEGSCFGGRGLGFKGGSSTGTFALDLRDEFFLALPLLLVGVAAVGTAPPLPAPACFLRYRSSRGSCHVVPLTLWSMKNGRPLGSRRISQPSGIGSLSHGDVSAEPAPSTGMSVARMGLKLLAVRLKAAFACATLCSSLSFCILERKVCVCGEGGRGGREREKERERERDDQWQHKIKAD